MRYVDPKTHKAKVVHLESVSRFSIPVPSL